MHILDECKLHFSETCPGCLKVTKARQIRLSGNDKATITYHCDCGQYWSRKIRRNQTVETIGD
jgi:lysyl-tRNA synthetase class I